MTVTAAAWLPTEAQARASRLWRFMHDLGCSSYPQLCQKAGLNPSWFWDALVKELGIVWSAPYAEVMDTSPGVPLTRWFPGGRLNAYESAVVRYRRSDPDRLAIIGETEAGDSRQLTYAQLDATVERVAAGLREIGVGRGVAVGLYLPLVIENAVALLACTKLGAVAVPLFSGFGAEAIRQRLSDAEARVLITADAAVRRGRPVTMKPIAAEAANGRRCQRRRCGRTNHCCSSTPRGRPAGPRGPSMGTPVFRSRPRRTGRWAWTSGRVSA